MVKIYHRHDWNLTAEEAIALQQVLRAEVVTQDDFGDGAAGGRD